jgi:hypothetical protein
MITDIKSRRKYCSYNPGYGRGTAETRSAYKVAVENFCGTKPLRSHEHIWQNTIRIHIKLTVSERMDWIRDSWCVVMMVRSYEHGIQLSSVIKGRHVLTIWASIRFSTRILSYGHVGAQSDEICTPTSMLKRAVKWYGFQMCVTLTENVSRSEDQGSAPWA